MLPKFLIATIHRKPLIWYMLSTQKRHAALFNVTSMVFTAISVSIGLTKNRFLRMISTPYWKKRKNFMKKNWITKKTFTMKKNRIC